ncbi:MAG: PorP/SprF family type IX secretion system membrane protein [Paludibacteraceae bacterium]|nr:PorP/SprF family type IX secretion system membrane protein [Paludibacteraceae bacterium]
MRKLRLLFSCIALSVLSLYAQNDFTLSEQLFSRIRINPAGTGNSANVNIFSINRFQYAGMEGAPFTTLLNVQTYIEKAKSGIGVSFNYDKSGIAYHQIDFKAVYAYHLNFGKNNVFSFGVGLGLYNKEFDPSKHVYEPDPLVPDRYQKNIKFDASFGIEYANPYILLGVSINHIPGFFYEQTTMNSRPSYYAYARGLIPCCEKFKLAPALVYYYTGQYHVIDANVTGFIGKYVYVGLGYKTETTAYAMVGFEWNWLRIGYACDVNIGKISNLAWTSHEVMLSFNIPTKRGNDGKWIY